MLYWLNLHLVDLHGGFNVLRYVTFRCAAAATCAFLCSILLGRPIINWLLRIGASDSACKDFCEDINKLHTHKQGKPSMGGVLILISVTVAVLICTNLTNRFVWVALVSMLWLGAIGFADDITKIKRGNGEGIPGRYKFAAQIALGVCVGAYLLAQRPSVAALWRVDVADGAYAQYLDGGLSTVLTVPFLKDVLIRLSAWAYLVLAVVVIVGASNAVNLTDGLDGLAIGTVSFVGGIYVLLAYVAGHWKLAQYIGVLFVDGSSELAVVCSALVGAGLGFLWFNSHPAEVIMGDTGSLALGGLIGTVALVAKQEALLIIVGGIFVAEAMSVILQVASYKLRNGKRIFLMSPLHHHFELRGLPESKIIVRFWICQIILGLIGLSTLKIR